MVCVSVHAYFAYCDSWAAVFAVDAVVGIVVHFEGCCASMGVDSGFRSNTASVQVP